jgi:hypothetical protein
MRSALLSFVVSISACVLMPPAVWAMQVRVLSSGASGPIGQAVIVGRAQCLGETWLLTDQPALTRVSADSLTVSSVPLRGLREGERPWGLACLPERELWTLITHQALARVTSDGRLVERVRLDRPRLGVFTAGERMLLQHAPTGIGKPLLAAGLPGRLSAFALWPAPVGQAATTADQQIRANLVNCGIGAAGYVPCWLAAQPRVALSDGTATHTKILELSFVRAGPVDSAAPIWDLALTGSSRLWVLASARSGSDGRRSGGRLTKSTRLGADEGFIDLDPSARLILWAADDRCVLLSVTGQLLEVFAP